MKWAGPVVVRGPELGNIQLGNEWEHCEWGLHWVSVKPEWTGPELPVLGGSPVLGGRAELLVELCLGRVVLFVGGRLWWMWLGRASLTLALLGVVVLL